MISNFIIVAIGGAVGATLRYAFSLIKTNSNFPWQTFMVNVLGSFVIGIIIAYFKNAKMEYSTYLLLATGICGGFTTFSTFNAENMALLHQQKFVLFGTYFLATVAFSLIATFAGYQIGKTIS